MRDLFENKWFKVAVILLGILFVYYPWPYYKILFTLFLTIPLLTIFIYGYKNSSFATWYKIDYQRNGKCSYEFSGVLNIPTWFLAFRVLIDFYFEMRYLTLYPIIVVLAMVFLCIFLPTTGKGRQPRKVRWPQFWLRLMLGLNLVLYIFTFVYGVNCVFDYSKPAIYNVKIMDKIIISGKGNTKSYKIKLSPWGDVKRPKEIKIDKVLYERLTVGDTIEVNHKNGFFNLPWYYVNETDVEKYIANSTF